MEYRPEFALLTNACLNLTDACNLECRYCFVEQHPHYMSIDTAKKGIEFLINNLHEKKRLNIVDDTGYVSVTYFGGEPMLCYDSIIVPVTEWAKEKYGNEISFAMTTNGTLLTPERIKWLSDNHIGLLLSIDGAKPTQDYNRPCRDHSQSSFDLIMPNIPDLLEAYPDLTFRSTIAQNTVDQTFSNFLFAVYLGFKNIFMTPDCRTKWTNQQVQLLEQEYEKIFDYFMASMRGDVPYIDCSSICQAFRMVLIHDLDVMNGTLNKKVDNKRSIMRCGMGTGMGSIGFNGLIYGCQEQDSKDEKNIFCIGDIEHGINQEKHLYLLNSYQQEGIKTCEDPFLCDNCPLCSQCDSAGCPSSVWDLFHNFQVDAKIHCQWMQIMFYQAARVMHILVAENNEKFKRFLNDRCDFSDYWEDAI